MTQFLEKTAGFLKETYQNDFTGIAVVLPNRRAGLYLRRYLSQGLAKPAWAPQFFSIEDFMTSISGLKELEPLPLLFELYAVHRDVEGDKAQPFEEFMRWGQQLLSDFNEVDRYLVDPQALFSYLDEARAIALWNLENQPLTEFEQNYLRFYHNLFLYYRELTERLLSKGVGYPGLIFRQAAEKADEYVNGMPYRHIVFAGFNALTHAEEEMLTVLHRNRKATLLWDADPYYLNDEHQEAGTFLRAWIRKWPADEIRWISDDFSAQEKNIRIVGAPDQMGQVKYCGNILREIALKQKPSESTAVVLLDPGLLVPLLNSLPQEIREFNITAGLPLSQTPLAGLFEAVFRIHLNASRFTFTTASGSQRFYYKDLLNLLMNPLVQRIANTHAQGNRFLFDDFVGKVRAGQKVFLSLEDMRMQENSLFSASLDFVGPLLMPWKDAPDAIMGCKRILGLLKMCFTNPEAKLEMEYVYSFTRILNQLSSITDEFKPDITLPMLYQVFTQILASTTLPFFGEPLKGIQIMGMLETRTLDFDNIILLSCNEDLLPSSKSAPSFIPFDIKRNFGLPTYRYKDSVYAYHFYRLLQRASHSWILYITEPDQLGGGDKSRFIKQIQHELRNYNPTVSISESFLVTPVSGSVLQPEVTVAKSEDVMKLLNAKAEKGFSATSLNAYRNCGLKFYFTEIAGIREPDDADDSIDPAVLGSAVHEALQRLFKKWEKADLSPAGIDAMLKDAEGAVEKAFEKKFKGSDIRYGRNLLLVHVAKLMVSRFLKYEKQELQDGGAIKIEGLEHYLETRLPASASGPAEIRIKGIIDRIDHVNGQLRIIDYKTGNIDAKSLKIKNWDDLIGEGGLDIAFQMMIYAFLLKDRIMKGQKVVSGIYPLKKINSGLLRVTLPEETGPSAWISAESIERFEEILQKILASVFNPGIPFSQTTDTGICKHCPFITLCGR